MNEEVHDLVVIGDGPGGQVGAVKAAKLEKRVAVVGCDTYRNRD